MNEASEKVREAAREVVLEILAALGVKPREIESRFRIGAAGAAIELTLMRFASAILEQAASKPGIAVQGTPPAVVPGNSKPLAGRTGPGSLSHASAPVTPDLGFADSLCGVDPSSPRSASRA